ncbi:MAG TPA: Gfo/Idh/MocA family oxidoreductase [Bryobacteraceae bacterium]|nr:Gfo/Idh/MocA family oxidoreductase [Bryobacteraceae bacterium]
MAQTTGRRVFLQSTAGVGGLLLLKPQTVFGSQANSAVELGIIGCGGRGNWIGGHFVEHTGARVVALADPFRDRLEAAAQKFQVPPGRLHAGLDAYRGLLASKLDAVAIESPPYFHPEQAAAALEAGKHIYLAKPVAVDVPGCQSIMDTGEKAEGKISFLVDFQTRARPVFQEAFRRVLQGEIGAPVMGHVYYHTGRLRRQDKPGMSAGEARLRNWTFDKRLSGDIIVEQHIHVLDVANWFLQSHPDKAFGTGGRKARVDVGDAWDHFLVTYWYPNEVHVDFSSNQFLKGFHDMCIRLYGADGTVDAHYGGSVRITGDTKWDGAEKDDTFTGGAVTNVKDFVASIRSGNYLNNASVSAKSNLTAILGRMAAYRESVVTWDEMMRSGERYEANLRL